MQNPHNPTNNHYDAIFLFDKLGQVCHQDKITFESPSPTCLQLIIQHDADEVIDLTDDSETIIMQHHFYCPYNNNSNEFKFPTNLFMNVAPEWVEDVPQDIDGMKIYEMKCLLGEWVQKSQDLRYFKMHSLRRKGLIGTRKVGRCVHISSSHQAHPENSYYGGQ